MEHAPEEQLDSVTIERLRKQGKSCQDFRAEFAKDPISRATESSRSNVIALWRFARQLYGEVVAQGVAIPLQLRRTLSL
jgi:hypothetical protein